jgi:predicted DsbA family dithiol-disulfide isomerase
MIDVETGTVVLYGDIACPWATCAVARLHRTRRALGLDERVRLDHRAFALELLNRRPTPKRTIDAEVPVVGGIEPGFGFQVWTEPDWTWPVTVLLALEAVQAAKCQGLAASEQLDLALRRAMFCESRCISLRSVVLDVASACEDVDEDALALALDTGEGRRAVMDQLHIAQAGDVRGSPHLFLPDGSDYHNPGIRMHWEGEHGRGFPVVDDDDPGVYRSLLARAIGQRA